MSLEAPISDSHKIVRKSIHGIFWNYASFGLGKFLLLVTTAILARLLTPNEFGIVAFATLAVDYLSILKDLGLGAALIHRRQDVEEAADTVFTLNLILNVTLTLITLAIAPLVAVFFREPLIIPILRWLSLTFVFNALGSIHIVRLQRELAFQRKLLPDLGRSVFKGLVSIGLALAGFGVWSLVLGQLVGVATGTLVAWLVFSWRPRLAMNTRLVKGLLKYGISVVGVDALTVATDNFDYLIVGRAFGNTALGIYSLAFRLPQLLVLNPLWIMAGAIFPAYATIQDQPEKLRRGFLTTVRFVEILSVPFSLGLLMVADPLVRVVFGEQWLEAIPIVRLLAFFVLVRSIGFNAGDVYKAVGRPDVLVKVEVLNALILAPALWFGSYFGLIGVATGHILASLVRMSVDLVVASRFIEVKVSEILVQLKPSFLGGLILILLVPPCLYLTTNLAPILRLLIATTAGGIGYIGVLWFLEKEALLHLARLAGLPLGGRKSSTALTPAPDIEVS